MKNNLLKKFITAKDPQVKEKHHKECKDYKTLLPTISKQNKTNYYNHYFESNWNSIKNTWKDLKSILTIKNISADIPSWYHYFHSNGNLEYLQEPFFFNC